MSVRDDKVQITLQVKNVHRTCKCRGLQITIDMAIMQSERQPFEGSELTFLVNRRHGRTSKWPGFFDLD